jgi:hypothetical protein
MRLLQAASQPECPFCPFGAPSGVPSWGGVVEAELIEIKVRHALRL